MEQELIDPKLLKIIQGFFGLLFSFSLFLSVILIIYLGIMYITKSEEGAEKVHQLMPYVIGGLILAMLSFAIPKLVTTFFK